MQEIKIPVVGELWKLSHSFNVFLVRGVYGNGGVVGDTIDVQGNLNTNVHTLLQVQDEKITNSEEKAYWLLKLENERNKNE